MSIKKHEKSSKGFLISIFAIGLLAVVGAGLYFGNFPFLAKLKSGLNPDSANSMDAGKNTGAINKPVPLQNQDVVDVDGLSRDEKLRLKMRDRKEKYGVDRSVDAILKSDESLKVGDSTVPMQEVLEKIRIKRGELVEDALTSKLAAQDSGNRANGSEESIPSDQNVFGIYVVKSNDNIWNIHFAFLKDYFENKGIRIENQADEPDELGFSSGVGKLLKFSEKIVYIYNVRDRKLDVDLDLINPSSKIVVFHMGEIFAFLDELDLRKVDRIQFDGENLWIPADQG